MPDAHTGAKAVTSATPSAVALLALIGLKRIGRATALKIVDQPIPVTASDASRAALIEGIRHALPYPISASDLDSSWARSQEHFDRCKDQGIQALSFHDDCYPERLRRIPDPPAVLFVKGSLEGTHAAKSLAVVGARAPTAWARAASRDFAHIAAESGRVIVSGLAHGCDTLAHKGCLVARGVGVAVLAHGLDRIYPAANRDLADDLMESGGCLISEYPPGVRPSRLAFADRDRLQSGLADAVCVIETDVGGGAMHTVRFARKQGRTILCAAHPTAFLRDTRTRGNQKLLHDGWAKPIPDVAAFRQFIAETELGAGTFATQTDLDFGA